MTNDEHFLPTFLARQPIFDGNRKVSGYELLFRGGQDAESAVIADGDQATSDVAAAAISSAGELLSGDQQVWVNFGHQSIVDDVAFALPPTQTVVQVPEPLFENPAVREAVARLKESGYMVAVEDFSGRGDLDILKELADYAIIDVLGTSAFQVGMALGRAKELGIKTLAKKVESDEEFGKAKKKGFTRFQGYFFRRPELVSGRKLTSHESSRFKLLREIESPEPDFNRLASAIERDVSISYRLLAYLNSASFGFRQQIKSIKQASVLLGWNQLKSWLRLIILTDLTPKKDNAALFVICLHRATFFQLVTDGCNKAGVSPDDLYLMGLFSMLDALLGMPMSEIVENLPLEDEVKKALCGEQNDFSPWLEMAEAFEKADWGKLDGAMQTLGCNSLFVAMSYYDSLPMVKEFLSHSGMN